MKAAKALFAAVTAGLSGLITTISGSESIGGVTTLQWLVIALAVLTAGGGVYGITNSTGATGK